MARPRVKTETMMGGKFETDLAVKFGRLTKENGVSIKEGLRRLMTFAILENRLPGINSLELHEQRENAKYGDATPTFDGSEQHRPEGGRVEPKPRAL